MRRTWTASGLAIAAVSVTAGAGAVAGGASGAGAGTTAGDRAPRMTPLRFELRMRPFADSYVDLGETGPTVGDLIVFHDRVLDWRGRRVGTEAGTCTVTALRAHRIRSTASARCRSERARSRSRA